MANNDPRAIVLLSGGLDSATAAAYAKDKGYELFGLTILYGQRHSREIGSAKAIGKVLGFKGHLISEIPLGQEGSALTNPDDEVPLDRDIESQIKGHGIPLTYVPARNLIFLSIAAHWAEIISARAIFTGFNAVDYSGYPDCSQEFVDAFQKTLTLGTKAGVEGAGISVIAPLINLSKTEIIKLGLELEVPFHLTWSCYTGDEKACGRCDSCLLRLKGFEEANVKDPIEYYRRTRIKPDRPGP